MAGTSRVVLVVGGVLAALLVLAGPARPAAAATGDITAFAGTGTLGWSGDGGPALGAQLQIQDVATDGFGNTYVLGYEPVYGNTLVRRITPGGTISTIAGDGEQHLGPPSGEGGPATEAFLGYFAQSIDVDGAGNVYVLTAGRIWTVTPAGTLVSVVGGAVNPGQLSDTYVPAASFPVSSGAMAVAPTGEVWFAEQTSALTGGGPALWKLDDSGMVRLVAGLAGTGTAGDGGKVADAQLQSLGALAFAPNGDLYVSDGARVRKVTPAGTITTVAGQADQYGYDGDGGPATSAMLQPSDLAVRPDGALLLADPATHVVRKVQGGTISTIAGTPGVGYPASGDGGPASAAVLRGPERIAALPAGHLVLAESQDNVVRRIAGTSAASAPGAPTAVIATPAAGSASVSWAAPVATGGSAITGYAVEASPGGAAIAVGNVTTASFPGLADGTSYTFTVRARSAYGMGAASNPSAGVTPRSAPGAPTGASAFPATASAQLSWTAPVNTGGSALTGYQVTVVPGGTVLELGPATATTVTGLANGTSYTFTVRARNVAGLSAASPPTASVVPTTAVVAPSPARTVVATAGASSVNLTWAPPAWDGGGAVTGYRITAQPGGAVVDVGDVVAASIPNLVDGVAYRFTVVAKNSAGTGAPSAPSNPATPAGAGDLFTLAGGGGAGDGLPGTQVGLSLTGPIAEAPDGTLYLGAAHQLRKVAPDGTISRFGPEWWGEDGPGALAVDAAGNVYVGEGPYVYAVTPAGAATVWAGAGKAFGDCQPWQEEPTASMPAAGVFLCDVSALAFDPAGNLVVADDGNDLVRRITPGKVATVIAGAGVLTGEGVSAHDSSVLDPVGLAVDSSGRTHVLQAPGHGNVGYVRRIASGTITTVAGSLDGTGTTFDGQPATAARLRPTSVAIDGGGALLIAEMSRIRRVAGGSLTTAVGTGVVGDAGDGSAPTAPGVRVSPSELLVDATGTLLFTNQNLMTGASTVRTVRNGILSTVAGNHEASTIGDGLPATAVPLSPYGVATDSAGNTYVGDTLTNRVRRVGPDGIITTVAGDGERGHAGDGGPATAAAVIVEDVAVDGLGNLFIASQDRLRKVAPDGTIATVWQQGEGPLAPFGFAPITADAAGNVYVAIRANQVAKIAPNGQRTVYAGDPEAVAPGDGGPATAAGFVGIADLAIDASGRLVIADQYGGRVRKVTGTTISTVAGDPSATALGDGGPATAAQLHPTGVAVDASGVLYVSDGTDDSDPRIRKVSGGTITTVAGGNGPGDLGDGGPGTAAQLSSPADLAALPGGRIVISDDNVPRIRVLVPGSSPATAPSPPRDATAAIDGGSPRTATITWTVPSTTGGSPVTGYQVTAAPGGATAVVGAGELTASIPNLTIGTTYTFTVRAQNAVGWSQPSAPTAPVTPVMQGDVPGAVPFATAVAGDGQATVSWTSPASNGGLPITGYTITRSPGGQSITTDAFTFNATLTGLTNGVSYAFTVQAENGNGLGAGKVSNAVVPHGAATAPGAPTGVTAAVAGFGAATVSWVLPADGGSPITSIVATSTPGGFACSAPGTATSCTITGLANGTSYRFSVVATNAVGPGPASALSDEVTTPALTNCGPGFVGPFADVPGTHPFCADIEWLSARGITGGFGDGGFHPSAAVTRQSVAAFLYRYAGKPAFVPPLQPTFVDVPVTHPFFLEIEWLAHSGITGGFADGGYHPTAPVTRQSMAAFLYRSAGLPGFAPPATPTFVDVPADHRFRLEIEWLADTGVTGGFGDGGYHPSDAVSRQAMAAFLHRFDGHGPG